MYRFIAILLCFVASPLFGNKNLTYFKVKIKNGDGIITLFQRYELKLNECNTSKFYELNNIKKGSDLFTHKEYYLPIKVYKYNGISIRSTLKIDDKDLAKDIQAFNETLFQKGLKKKTYSKNSPLWVSNDKLGCENVNLIAIDKKDEIRMVSKDNPSKTTAKKETKNEEEVDDALKTSNAKAGYSFNSLFGPKYENINMFDYRLKGQVFYISSGHGGPDPGTMCNELIQPICEDEYAYDVALRLARDLMQHGATVHVIIQDENDGIRDDEFLDCDYDELCSGKNLPLRQLDRLKQRADHINRLYRKYKKQGVKTQKAIMIHVDSRSKEQRQDVFFYHYSSEDKKLAINVQETFEKKYNEFQSSRGFKGTVSERGLYMLRKVDPTAVYVELANINNKNDQRRIMDPLNRQALANWLFEGVSGIVD